MNLTALAILAAGYVVAILALLLIARPARTPRYPVRPYREMPTPSQPQTKADQYTLAA